MTWESHAEAQQAMDTASGPIGTLVFLCGADMKPSSITGRAGFDRARFVATASMEGEQAAGAGLPPTLASGPIWGIALTIDPEAASTEAASATTVSIVLRDGTAAEAILITSAATAGTVAEVLREAHYWELPMEYRNRLQALHSGDQGS